MPAIRHCLISADGTAHILFERGGKALQVRITGASISAGPVQLFAEAAVEPDGLKVFQESQDAFNRLTGNRAFPMKFDYVTRDERRLDLMLKALDGWAAGASQRDIAIGLFGRSRVETDWGGQSDHLKSQVRRLVRRGRWLMLGGYRSLLR